MAEPKAYLLEILWEATPDLDDSGVLKDWNQELKDLGKPLLVGSLVRFGSWVLEDVAVVDVEGGAPVGGQYGSMWNFSALVHSLQVKSEDAMVLQLAVKGSFHPVELVEVSNLEVFPLFPGKEWSPIRNGVVVGL